MSGLDRFTKKQPAASPHQQQQQQQQQRRGRDPSDDDDDDADAPESSDTESEAEDDVSSEEEEEEEASRRGGNPFAPAAASSHSHQRAATSTSAPASNSRSAGASSAASMMARAEQARRVEAQREAAIAEARRMRAGGGGGGGGGRGRDDDSDDDDDDEEDDDEEEDLSESEEELPPEDDAASQRKYKQPKLKFDLQTFSGAFDAGSFVSDLTRDLFAQQSDSADFDPAPFQTLFSSALSRLRSLRDETDRNILACVRRAKVAEEAHREGLANLHEQVGVVFTKFRRLDGRILSVAHTAVRIGHTLQSVDAQKRNNIAGQEIIQHFLAFNEAAMAMATANVSSPSSATTASSSSSATGGAGALGLGLPPSALKLIPAIYSTTDSTELHRAASLIQMLSAISTDVMSLSSNKVHHANAQQQGLKAAGELIARTSNAIENQLIGRFDSAARAGNLMEMKACANTLLNFRGRSIIKRYVFTVIEKLQTYASSSNKQITAEEKEMLAKGGRGRNESAGGGEAGSVGDAAAAEERSTVGQFKLSLSRLYRAVIVSVKEQCAVCAVIFPQPLSVIRSILERVFQDKIQGLIDSALQAPHLPNEEWLRMLDFAWGSTGELVSNIMQAVRSISAGSNGVTGGSGGGSGASGGDDEQLDGGFGGSGSSSRGDSLIMSNGGRGGASGSSFSSSSSSTPSSSSSGLLLNGAAGVPSGGGNDNHMNLPEQVSGIFASYKDAYFPQHELPLVRNVTDRAIRGLMDSSMEDPDRSAGEHGEEDRDLFGRLKKEVVDDQKQRWILRVLEGGPSESGGSSKSASHQTNLVDFLVSHSTVALKRCDRLSDPPLLADHASQLFLHICSQVLDKFLLPVFESAMQFLPALGETPKQEPDTFLFQVVGLANLIVDKLHLHYSLFVLPRVATNPNTQLITDARVGELFAKLESLISNALARLLGGHVKYTARLLSQKQKSTDYKPRDDDSDAVLDGKPSAACEAVCASVRTHSEAVQTCLDGKNLDKYLHVMGIKLHDTLVAHLHKLTINTMGAGLLARDLKEYQRVVGSFCLPSVQEKWTELRQLIDLFFVGPDHLRAVINDSAKLTKMAQTEQHYLLAFIQMRADYSDNKRRILQALHLKDGDE